MTKKLVKENGKFMLVESSADKIRALRGKVSLKKLLNLCGYKTIGQAIKDDGLTQPFKGRDEFYILTDEFQVKFEAIGKNIKTLKLNDGVWVLDIDEFDDDNE